MKVLLDTHPFLWAMTDPPRLSIVAREIILTRKNQVFLSAASGWELAIKAKLGKLDLPQQFETFMARQLWANEIDILPIQMNHALHVYKLPYHHSDPFDRMLVAQSQLENLPIITVDRQIVKYNVKVLW